MCLVLSVLLGSLGINFYLNGFYLQAGFVSALSIGSMLLMIRNISCRKNSCSVNKTTTLVNDKMKQNKNKKVET